MHAKDSCGFADWLTLRDPDAMAEHWLCANIRPASTGGCCLVSCRERDEAGTEQCSCNCSVDPVQGLFNGIKDSSNSLGRGAASAQCKHRSRGKTLTSAVSEQQPSTGSTNLCAAQGCCSAAPTAAVKLWLKCADEETTEADRSLAEQGCLKFTHSMSHRWTFQPIALQQKVQP
jgi:hypothetical protein